MKVIINADDCGKDRHTDEHIVKIINAGKLTSTTIMANMPDVEYAKQMFDTYKDTVSFGCHLNLTEGYPLLNQEILLSAGVCRVDPQGTMVLDWNRSRNMPLSKNVRDAVYNELDAQITKLEEMGVTISHLDSHHHIHTAPCLMGVVAALSKKHNIYKVRRIRNFIPFGISYISRDVWYLMSKMNNMSYTMTDYFCSYSEYMKNPSLHKFKNTHSIELMVHPGHSKQSSIEEERSLLEDDFPDCFELINYNQL